MAFDMPGTTRDAITVPFERAGQKFELIDTAGLRRKGRDFEAIEKFSGNKAALTDLSHLPSHKNEGDKSKAQRDQEVTKELKLKSWDGKKVRSFVSCFHCGKRRCIYSPTDDAYI